MRCHPSSTLSAVLCVVIHPLHRIRIFSSPCRLQRGYSLCSCVAVVIATDLATVLATNLATNLKTNLANDLATDLTTATVLATVLATDLTTTTVLATAATTNLTINLAAILATVLATNLATDLATNLATNLTANATTTATATATATTTALTTTTALATASTAPTIVFALSTSTATATTTSLRHGPPCHFSGWLLRHLVVFVAASTSAAMLLSSALSPVAWVAALSFATSSVISIVVRCLHSILVVFVDICIVVCIAPPLRCCQLHRSKHSGNRRCMLGMNLVRKDIKSNMRDGGQYYETGSSWAENDMAHAKNKQNQQERG
jgi:hypothetical protein